jgi:hypothetical protein
MFFFFVSKGKKGVRIERQSEVKKGGLSPLFPPAFFTSLTAQRKEKFPKFPMLWGFRCTKSGKIPIQDGNLKPLYRHLFIVRN